MPFAVRYSPVLSEEFSRTKLVTSDTSRNLRKQLCISLLLILSILLSLMSLSIANGRRVIKVDMPPLGSEIREFKNHIVLNPAPEFGTVDTSGYKSWNDLLPPNGGFLVKEVNGTRRNFGITMFHQLHCIQMLRASFQVFLAQKDGAKKTDSSQGKHSSRTNSGRDGFDTNHYTYCFDFLRQACI
jgi:hypothetical protein